MRYFKRIENGVVCVVGIGLGDIEITEEEYTCLKSEMFEKSDIADNLYWGRITIEEVPEEWREEVQNDVNARIAENGTADEQEISAEDALAIIMGGVSE